MASCSQLALGRFWQNRPSVTRAQGILSFIPVFSASGVFITSRFAL